jgi:hypothetical protein
MNRLLLLIPVAVLTLAGCVKTPTWSKATTQQRAAGDFKIDWAYFDSPQSTNDANEDADTVIRLRKQLGRTQ